MLELIALLLSVFLLYLTARWVYKRNTDICEIREEWGVAYRKSCEEEFYE